MGPSDRISSPQRLQANHVALLTTIDVRPARFGRGREAEGFPWLVASDTVRRMARHFVVYNGVIRATRIAMLSPGTLVRVEAVGRLRREYGLDPKIGDQLP